MVVLVKNQNALLENGAWNGDGVWLVGKFRQRWKRNDNDTSENRFVVHFANDDGSIRKRLVGGKRCPFKVLRDEQA